MIHIVKSPNRTKWILSPSNKLIHIERPASIMLVDATIQYTRSGTTETAIHESEEVAELLFEILKQDLTE